MALKCTQDSQGPPENPKFSGPAGQDMTPRGVREWLFVRKSHFFHGMMDDGWFQITGFTIIGNRLHHRISISVIDGKTRQENQIDWVREPARSLCAANSTTRHIVEEDETKACPRHSFHEKKLGTTTMSIVEQIYGNFIILKKHDIHELRVYKIMNHTTSRTLVIVQFVIWRWFILPRSEWFAGTLSLSCL